jgi:cation diffusion facilitator CzcD-associated flavoprotein CzcO
MYKQGSELSNQFRQIITDEMHRRLGPGHEDLKKFLVPTWAPGCRRISPGDGYLEALVQPNVEPVYSGITKITPDGMVTADGKEHKLDIIVCATGFQVAFKPAFRVINGEGKTVDEDWEETGGINLYFGTAAPRFPNFFTIVGPGATWSNGTLLPSIETTIEYIIKVVKKMSTEHIKAIEVKQEALNEIYAHFYEFHKSTVWQEDCRSWFKDGKIKNRIYLWTGSVSSLPSCNCLGLATDNSTDYPLPQVDQESPLRRLQLRLQIQE